jgi:hypothetical protein
MAGMKRSLAALAVAVAACAPLAPQTRNEARAYARPEPDPSCRGQLSQCLTVTGLEQVTVKVAVSEEGRLSFVDVLTPGLTDSDNLEIRRALEGCMWKPAVDAAGRRVEGTFTLAIQR